MPNDLNAIDSGFEDNFTQYYKVYRSADIRKDKDRKIGKLYNNTFSAKNNGRLNSIIFLIRLNIAQLIIKLQ